MTQIRQFGIHLYYFLSLSLSLSLCPCTRLICGTWYIAVLPSFSLFLHQADVWLYNLADEVNLKLKVKMEQICEWQAARAGLLHHLLAQKMGLFLHTQGRDIHKCTKVMAVECL